MCVKKTALLFYKHSNCLKPLIGIFRYLADEGEAFNADCLRHNCKLCVRTEGKINVFDKQSELEAKTSPELT